MNPARFLEHFERVAEAPDAIPRLRRFILDLAVRGKLVEQDPNDEPASELLKGIHAERERRVKTGVIKRNNLYPIVDINEVPFEVPSSWSVVRLGEALELINGRAFKPTEWTEGGLPIIRIQNLNNFTASFNYCNFPIHEKVHVHNGDFLISWSGTPGTSFGAHIWNRGHALLNQHIFKAELIWNAFNIDFLKLAINSRLLELTEQAHGGVGLQHITKPKLEQLPLTLPPLAEQHRIVAKVDELMALCDRLEASQAKRESRRDRLAAASLKRIGQPEDVGNGVGFKENVRFHLRHLPRLTTKPEHIKELRQTILNLAVRGKLVPQDPNDEPASALLKRVHTERALLSKAGYLKKDRISGDSAQYSEPFDIPNGWDWVLLQQIITFGPQNGISPKPSTSDAAPKAITLTATTSGKFDSRHYKYVEINVAKDSEFWLKPGDLLFQRGNTREYVGMAAFYDGEEGQFLYPDLMMKVRLSQNINLQYIHICSISRYAREYFSTYASGAQATMPKINQGTLVSLPVPIPPLSEQQRIVAKVDELMALCDQLELQLNTSWTSHSHLLEATLCEALGVSSIQAPHSKRPSAPAISPAPSPPTGKAIPKPMDNRQMRSGQTALMNTPQATPRHPAGNAPEAICAHMQPGRQYSRAQLCEATGLSVYEWNKAIRELKDQGRVAQTGERRGAKYALTA